MKQVILIVPAVLLFCGTLLYSETAVKKPCIECFNLHPEITPLDERGLKTSTPDKISSVKTCGKCHNAEYINNHNIHFNNRVKAGCIECHVCGSKINPGRESFTPSGNLDREKVRITAPRNENCSYCHGIVGKNGENVSIPGDYAGTSEYVQGGRNYSLTRNTGEIISPMNISESHLNLKGKNLLTYPWDVHSHREVYCISCHFTANDPKKTQTRKTDVLHNSNDPRKIFSICKYLYMPDHNFMTAECISCHEPEKVHKFLKYKKRHFEVLACQSCHVPGLYGPALKSVDETVVTEKGGARLEYRGIDGGENNLNTAYNPGYRPYLLSYTVNKPGQKGISEKHIAPFNLVTYFRWKDGTGKYIDRDLLKKVFFSGDSYSSDIIRLFDNNGNGRIDVNELVLDSAKKTDAIKSRLAAIGATGAEIAAEILPYRVNHGVADEKTVSQDCGRCHGPGSRFGESIALAGDKIPVDLPSAEKISDTDNVYYLSGGVEHVSGETSVERDAVVKNHYIFGYSRVGWLNILGFGLFLLTVVGISGHGFLRYLSSMGAPHEEVKTRSVYMYAFYERIWHWIMAFSVIMLVISGLEIHFTGSFNLFGFANSIDIHNAFALVVAVNAGLSLFYYSATGEIRRFFRINKGFGREAIAQGVYYLYGIFKKSPHPVEKTPERRYNPIQQITYVVLLNILFPLQIITGVMMWMVSVSPDFAGAVGGLIYIAPLHYFAAWLFITFLVMHLYLITTGHTILSNLKGMFTGTEEIEESRISGDVVRGELLKINVRDIISNIREIIKKK